MADPSPQDTRQIAQARLEAIVESSDDAIVSETLDGIVTSGNEGAERIFSYAAQETVGKPIYTLFAADRQDKEPQILARLRRGEPLCHCQTIRLVDAHAAMRTVAAML